MRFPIKTQFSRGLWNVPKQYESRIKHGSRGYNGRNCTPVDIYTFPGWCCLTLLLTFLSKFAKMKFTLILITIAIGVSAQCKTVGNIEKELTAKKNRDPFYQLDPKEAVFPCNFGAAVTLGKIPQGCGQLELIYGLYFIIFMVEHGFIPS
jgi:hypothetical protein